MKRSREPHLGRLVEGAHDAALRGEQVVVDEQLRLRTQRLRGHPALERFTAELLS